MIFKYLEEKILLVSVNDTRFGNRPLKFTNDLDLDDNGNIYFTDSCSERAVNEAFDLYVEGSSRGRWIACY